MHWDTPAQSPAVFLQDDAQAPDFQMQLVVIPSIANACNEIEIIAQLLDQRQSLRLSFSKINRTQWVTHLRQPFLGQRQSEGRPRADVNELVALSKFLQALNTAGHNLMKNSRGQKELVIAKEAKTITAVIKAYKTRELTRFDSDYVVQIKTEKKSTMLGEINYHYEEITPIFDDVAYKTTRRDYEMGRLVPIVELSPYLSTPLKSGVNSRWGLEADLAVYVIPRTSQESTASKFFETFMVGAALGYDYTDEIFNATNYSHGPMLKLIFDLKNTDIGFCLYAKWKFNHENDNNFQSFPFGGRVTFSRDFFALYAGVGNEPRYTDKQENIITVHGPDRFFPGGDDATPLR